MKRNPMLVLALFTVTSCALFAAGAMNYWDTNSDIAGFGTAGGTWGVNTNWSTDVTGSVVPAVADTTVDDDLFFGTATSGLAAGTITVDSTNQAFRSMTFGAASGPIMLTNGTLNLAAPASKIIVNNASNTIASALTGNHGLRKYAPPELSYTNFLTENAVIIFTNATLSDCVNAGGIMWGASITNTPANAYFFANNGTHATFQLQTYYNAKTVCVKVELTQVGADITGRTLYAMDLAGQHLGNDFDTSGNSSSIATSPAGTGYGVAQTRLLAVPHTYEPFLTDASAVVLTNVALATIGRVVASMGGFGIVPYPVPTTPYYFNNNGKTGTVQMQAFEGSYTKCVKIELTQSGSNVAARVIYAKYNNAWNKNLLGFDFDAGGIENSIATSFTGSGAYGIFQLRFLVSSKLTLTGVNTYTGDTAIDNGVLEISGAGLLGGGAYTGAIVNAGQIILNTTSNQTLAGNISGIGSLRKESLGKTLGTETYLSFLTEQSSVIFPNASLSECTGAESYLGGNAITGSSGGVPIPATTCRFQNNGTNVTWQVQMIDGTHTKCVKVELTQASSGIAARAVYAKYLLNTSDLGFDFDSGGNTSTVATSYTINGYGVPQFALTLNRHASLTLAGTNNTYTGGTVVNLGTLLVTGSANSLPSGSIIVNDDANLILRVPTLPAGNSGGVGNGSPITVNSGGMLTLAEGFNIGYSRLITINGGTFNSIYKESFDNGNYMNNLVLMNGATVIGYKIRVGNMSTATIIVSGTSPSTLEAGMTMVKVSGYGLTLHVSNATGDAACDFFIPGVIRDYSSGLAGMPIVKTGDGTVSFSGVNTFVGTTTITAGTLALGANTTLNTGNTIVLNSGTLDSGPFTNAIGTLLLNANSIIALGDGDGRLSFTDSSAVAWTAGASLTLTGTLGPQTVRVGTNASALTGEQLAAISYNGKHVRIRSDGYLSPWLKGTLLEIR